MLETDILNLIFEKIDKKLNLSDLFAVEKKSEAITIYLDGNAFNLCKIELDSECKHVIVNCEIANGNTHITSTLLMTKYELASPNLIDRLTNYINDISTGKPDLTYGSLIINYNSSI